MNQTSVLTILLAVVSPLLAFHGSIEGRVLDIESRPLTGAQVWLEGYQVGAATDPSGRYLLE